MTRSRTREDRGPGAMSLLEVMVAMVVMAGAAILVGSTYSSFRTSQDHVRLRTLVVELAQSRIDRLLKLSPRNDSSPSKSLGRGFSDLNLGAAPSDDISGGKGREVPNPPTGDAKFYDTNDSTKGQNPYLAQGLSFKAYASLVTGQWPADRPSFPGGIIKYQVDVLHKASPSASPTVIYRLSTLGGYNLVPP